MGHKLGHTVCLILCDSYIFIQLAKSFRDELENISLGANRKQQLVEDLNLKVLTYSRDKAMLQAQLKEGLSK